VVGTLLSFLLVGFVGVAGKRSGAPTFALSRSPFGLLGNVLPTTTSYLSLSAGKGCWSRWRSWRSTACSTGSGWRPGHTRP
jgi:purine-cytosine permease-like protein